MTMQVTADASPKGMGRLLLAATLATTFALGVGAGVAFRDATDGSGAGRAATAPSATTAVATAPARGGLGELYAEQQAARTRTFDGADTMGGMAELYRDQQRDAAVTVAASQTLSGRPLFVILDSEDQLTDPALAGGQIAGFIVAEAGEAAVRQAIADENEWRRGMGLAGVTVVDLRGR